MERTCFVSGVSVRSRGPRSREISVCAFGDVLRAAATAGASLLTLGVVPSTLNVSNILHGPGVELAFAAPPDVASKNLSNEVRAVTNKAGLLVKWSVYAQVISAATLSAFALTILGLYIIQDRLVYWPSTVSKGTPAKFGLAYEDVSFCTLDGIEISGWFIKREQSVRDAPTILYFHGTDKNASFRLRKAAELYSAAACNILLLSYRGYGSSKGRPSERGVCMDALSSFRYLKSRKDVDFSNVWVYGESLGGAVAVWFTERFQKNLKGLILENTFTSLLDMIKYVHPILDPLKVLSRNKWLSLKRIENIQIPLLFLSGEDDEFVPPVMMRQLFDAADKSPNKKFISFPGGTHNNTWRLKGFFNNVADFMKDNMTASYHETGAEPASKLTPSK
eukprot:Plantae.Rhodophyta-Purpureofilum_apyrenoidigerum.ctg1429.p1 GENE.Plantae.Rhodophyta-Purpureofilum_apyrenoidigerum.ctg1429~~Plantae.Rhodophyta-Purpureofilum_apyrenoidigerum.ctg1429.p1  ORF type:complete len:392 (+),score=55.24 Plantae.Rhodophyta-Purpureofilum_apyrenoidigerum.ctg1429:163-1338(+)